MPGLSVFTIAAAHPFGDSVAALWFDAAGRDPIANGDGLILVPTRRQARSLGESFLRAGQGQSLLLPRIEAIGAPDETGIALDAGFDLPPAIEPLQRLAALTRLILDRDGAGGAPRSADRAWALAVELAGLIDEAAREGVELETALRALAPAELAAHWQVTLDFLTVVTRDWPARLAEIGLVDPARRHAMLLAAQRAAWEAAPPECPVWLVGTVAATRALADLARSIARLPRGRVILPDLDLALDAASWEALEATHPQAGLRRLLDRIGVTRGDVRALEGVPGTVPEGRASLLRRALLPAPTLAGAWAEAPAPPPDGFAAIAAPDQQAEAAAVALALRDAIEIPGRRAALVTPDRGLARRVVAEIARFGVLADDSAGEALADTPACVLLRLIAETVIEDFPPATFLALLKHPLATFGLDPEEARRMARALERAVLRGPRPPAGIDGLRRVLDASRADADLKASLARFLDRVAEAIAPLATEIAASRVAPARLFAALIEAGDRVSTGARTLWGGEEGEALSAHLAALVDALALLPPAAPDILPGLLAASLAGIAVHGRRALRGRDALEIHPRVAIWGLLEARGQSADLLVLGGLTEGSWPSVADPGPWMGRNMRASVGLPSPEEAVGLAAHDFATLAGAAPSVILSYPARRDRAPAVPSRWIARLEASLGAALPAHPALAWARALDQPAGPPRPARPPSPRPPVEARPRSLSVTEIETWIRDPYAIHARHILRLPVLAPLEEEADHALFGIIVHDGLQASFRAGIDDPRALDAAAIAAALHASLDRAGVRAAIAAWWRPRLDRIAAWVAETERGRRDAGLPAALATEIKGKVEIDGPAGPFTLVGRADRIERAPDGTLAILDYKTGTPPPKKDVTAGWAPQLPLEATMAVLGAFGEAFRGAEIGELAHWRLSGGATPGEVASIGPADGVGEIVADAWHGLALRIAAFDDPDTPYLAHPHPTRRPRFDHYAALSRVAEWRLAEDEG